MTDRLIAALNVASPPSVDSAAVIDCLTPSQEASFYDEMFRTGGGEKPELWHEVKGKLPSDPEYVHPEWQIIVGILTERLPKDAIVVELGGGVHQQRSGFLGRHFANYVPLDISRSSIERYVTNFGRTGIVCDATRLPFRDASVDCVVSRTFLEHPRDPEAVLREIVRVTRPGSIVVHDDAWFVRWWHRYAIVGLKRFRSMNLRERAIFLASRITECKLVRFPPIIVRRLAQELFMKRSVDRPLPRRQLSPNYDLYLGCDEDAANSIDPLDVVRFYEAHGFLPLGANNLWARVFMRNQPVIMLRN